MCIRDREKEGVGTYREFTEKILPIIKKDGYNAVQLMAIAEHPYYGSFGYHVSSFFAPASRCGTPEELKELVRRAHELGLAVIMDLVHAHYVRNLNEGINELDGTDHHYCLLYTSGRLQNRRRQAGKTPGTCRKVPAHPPGVPGNTGKPAPLPRSPGTSKVPEPGKTQNVCSIFQTKAREPCICLLYTSRCV